MVVVHKYLTDKKYDKTIASRRLNVVDLIKKSKLEERKEKRRNIIVTAAAISALAVSGIIISL